MTASGSRVTTPTREGAASTLSRALGGTADTRSLVPARTRKLRINRARRHSAQTGSGAPRGLRQERTPYHFQYGDAMCCHQPPCPAATATDHAAARVVARQDDLGWALLCNGVVVFDDTGELLPDGTPIAPRRGVAPGHRRPLLAA
jgi:hypothetical protein